MVFSTPEGRRVLEYLLQVAHGTRIDGKDPNPNAALMKVAQIQLVRTIENMLK